LHFPYRKVYSSVEGEQLQDLGVEVDLRGKILDLDVDLTDVY
jgi:hypothetical protein